MPNHTQVAIVLPVEKVVRQWAEELNIECESLVELCQKKEIVDRMSEAVLKAAKEGNLTKTEIPAKIYVDGSFGETGWLPDSGLVTDAFKVNRRFSPFLNPLSAKTSTTQ